MISNEQAMNAWKTSPVAWETCWDMRKWVEEGWSLRFIFNYALALHGSYINNKSAPLPAGDHVRQETERFLQRLGYRLVLKQLQHPKSVRPGGRLELHMTWQNVGSAPCYRPYKLAYRLSNSVGVSHVVVSDITVSRWLPGSIELFTKEFFREVADLPPGDAAHVADSLLVPQELPSGDYKLSLAVVADAAAKPVVQLGISGREPDGWYPLSTVEVTR
jgi:hypothetical protein